MRRPGLWRAVVLHFYKPLDQLSELVEKNPVHILFQAEQAELGRTGSNICNWMSMSNWRKEFESYKISQRIVKLPFNLKLT